MNRTPTSLAALASLVVLFGCDQREAGNTTQTENTIGTLALRIDSVLPLWNRPVQKTTVVNSKALSKAEWKRAYYNRFPTGAIVTVGNFTRMFGKASQTQTVGQEAYWYFECSDGTIQVVLNDPNLMGAGACIQSVNDY